MCGQADFVSLGVCLERATDLAALAVCAGAVIGAFDALRRFGREKVVPSDPAPGDALACLADGHPSGLEPPRPGSA